MSGAKPSSSRVSGLLQTIERSSGGGLDDKSVDNVSQATAKVLRMLSQQEKSLTDSILRKSKVTQSLVTLLMTTQDVQLHLNIIHILEHVALSSSNKSARLVRQGTPHAILRSIASTSRVRPLLEELCLHQHLLLIKLAGKEKKLALKARLCGVVIITLDLAKQCINNTELGPPLLQVLKIYATNSSNSLSLVKNGLFQCLERYFTLYGKHNSAVFKNALELYAQLVCLRSNSVKAVSGGGTRRMLDLFLFWTDMDRQNKYINIRKSILTALKHLVGNESGRKALIKADGITVLYATAKQTDEMRPDVSRGSTSSQRSTDSGLRCPSKTESEFSTKLRCTKTDLFGKKPDTTNPNGKAIDNLALTCSQIIRKSMPKVCLPIPSLHGPVYFDEARLDDAILLQDYQEEGFEEEAEVEDMPLTLKNVDDFVNFFPEITDYHNTSTLIEQLIEFKKEYRCAQLQQQTPCNSQTELSDEKSPSESTICVTIKSLSSQRCSHSRETPARESPRSNGVRGDKGDRSKCPQNGKRYSMPSVQYSMSMVNMLNGTPLPQNFLPPPAKSVKHFVKVSAPDMYSHRPPHYLEPLYEPIQSVQRTLMLLDIARAVHPETLINRVAYDQDELVKTEDSAHAYSNVKWDPSLRRSKILPSVPQKTGTAASNGDVHDMNEDSSTATVNIPILDFESRFECGNLRKAIQVRIFEYDLILNSDIGSSRHHQWFFFEVRNMVADFPYRFNIINCEKSCSSFTTGMQPLIYSTNDALSNGTGWQRSGKRICYYKNNFIRKSMDDSDKIYGATRGGAVSAQTMYTLTFTICFPRSQDSCYIAYHYPFSYSMLQAHLLEVQHLPGIGSMMRRQHLCLSIGGNPIDLLTITQFPAPHDRTNILNLDEREYVVLTSRVHPGESNASWCMKGVINYLLSDCDKALQLRNKFIFKIIPMLNTDGVINGSHRCSLLGVDMNRQWLNPQPHLFPSLYHTKGILQLLGAIGRKPILFCDFHGHSRKKNVFMYGNITQPSDNSTVKLLPTILDIHAPAFSFGGCCFVVEKSRESTARVAVWRQFGIQRSYTLESTYCGTDQGLYKGRQIGSQHLEEMGAKFCEGLLIMLSADQPSCFMSDESEDDDDSFLSSDTDDTDDDDDDSSA